MPEAIAAAGNPNQKPSLHIIPSQTDRLSRSEQPTPEALTELCSVTEPVAEVGSLAVSQVIETAEQKLLHTKLTPEGIRAGMLCLVGHTKMIWAGAYFWADIKLGTVEAKSLAFEAPVLAIGGLMVAYSLNWKRWQDRRQRRRSAKIADVTKLPTTPIAIEPQRHIYDRPEDAA